MGLWRRMLGFAAPSALNFRKLLLGFRIRRGVVGLRVAVRLRGSVYVLYEQRAGELSA